MSAVTHNSATSVSVPRDRDGRRAWWWTRSGRPLIAALIAAVVATLCVALAAPASVAAPASAAAPAAPGTPIASLPFFANAGIVVGKGPGAPGSAKANAAVKKACNAGVVLYNPQWFTLPAGNLGKVYATKNGWAYNVGGYDDKQVGVAFVNTSTGAVVSCGAAAVNVKTAQPLSVVLYYAASQASCLGVDAEFCADNEMHLYLNRTTGAPPANDLIANAHTITTVPFTESLDNSFADDDGPALIDYDHCLLSTIDPVQSHTVWWKYIPTVTGPAPRISVKTTIPRAPPIKVGGFAPDFKPTSSILVSTPSGLVFPPKVDEWDCTTPPTLLAGSTYYIPVFMPWDHYSERALVTGGPLTVRVDPAAVLPGAPTRVAASVNGAARTATLSWSPPASNGGSPVTGYRVARNGRDSGGHGAWSAVLPASARSQTIRYLNAWDTYALTVRAITAVGTGPAGSKTVTVTAATSSAPLRVAAAARPGTGKVAVSWAAPVHPGASAVGSYRVRRFVGSGSAVQAVTTAAASARSLTVSRLTPGTGYTFDVTAVNASGPGRVSTRSAVTTPTVLPAAPAAVTASANGAARTATVSWLPPASNGGSPVTGYRVARNGRDSGGHGALSAVLPASARSRSFRYLNAWDTYALTVRAITASGTGPAASRSATVTATTPSAPTSVLARAGNRRVALTWGAPRHAGTSAVRGYVVKRYVGPSSTAQAAASAAGSARSFPASGLLNGTAYTFAVTAVNASGFGRASARTAPVTPHA